MPRTNSNADSTSALAVSARYLASMLICRMIVAYELRGMKAAARIVEEEGQPEQSLVLDTLTPGKTAKIRGDKNCPVALTIERRC